jgi:hypothetical protein
MRASAFLNWASWSAAVIGGCLSVAVAVAQEPGLMRAGSAGSSRSTLVRPPAALSAPRYGEEHYQVPQPGRLSSAQTAAARPLPSRAGEIGSGVRQVAYQDLAETQPYYVPGSGRVEQLPPAISGSTPQSWPGGQVIGPTEYYDPGYANMGNAPCNPACDPFCMPPPLIGMPCLSSLELIAGAHGFTGPLNRGAGGSFGFHEGAQIGLPVFGLASAEFGVLVTQNNFEGSSLTPDDRSQLFLTAGGFRRVDWGLQGGLVFDYLHDDWDYRVDLAQLRGEISYVLPCGHDIGGWFTVGVNDARSDVNVIQPVTGGPEVITRVGRTFDVNDIFAFFYRRQFACGGEGRLFGGFTSEGEGLFGGDFRFPINPCWAFEADFLYVGAKDSPVTPAFADENWNVSLQVVWTPWARNCGKNYDRPLLGVANNGSFLTTIR